MQEGQGPWHKAGRAAKSHGCLGEMIAFVPTKQAAKAGLTWEGP